MSTEETTTATTGQEVTRDLGRCDWSDLPIAECAHCQGLTSPVVPIGVVERSLGRRAAEYRVRPREWSVADPEVTCCTHRQDDLCGDCAKLLDALIIDVPELVAQLTTSMRKGGRFGQHGWRRGDVERPDESPIPWSPPAAKCLSDLRQFVANAPADRHLQLEQLSRLARRAHRIINRPAERETTICPTCRAEIAVPDDDPEDRVIVCPTEGCSYAATWPHHLRDLLDANGDALLTAQELRFVLSHNGEPITRQRIAYLVERHGLPREQRNVPSWVGANIVTEARWVYRLKDVRDLQARLAS